MKLKKSWLGFAGALLVLVVVAWLLGGGRVSCRESFWDKNKQVIEITK
jgi:CDP-diglyceride synthetase